MDYQAGFYPLGDIAVASHSRPRSVALTVSAQDDDALAPPLSFSEIWRDSGSGADKDVKVLRMDPMTGYTCLGHVAITGYNSVPDIKQYRFVLCAITGEVIMFLVGV